MVRYLAAGFLVAAIAASPAVKADTVHVGVTLSMTGPAASLGIPERNSINLLPKKIGGDDVEYTVLDDAGDTTQAVANMRKMIEAGADVIIGTSVTPGSLAMVRRGGRAEGADDLAGRFRRVDPADGCRPALGVQDAAER